MDIYLTNKHFGWAKSLYLAIVKQGGESFFLPFVFLSPSTEHTIASVVNVCISISKGFFSWVAKLSSIRVTCTSFYSVNYIAKIFSSLTFKKKNCIDFYKKWWRKVFKKGYYIQINRKPYKICQCDVSSCIHIYKILCDFFPLFFFLESRALITQTILIWCG